MRKDKILIVDDQENNRLVIVDILRKLKCDIKEASSGEEALILIRDWIPDLILMDQMMPGLSGVNTTARIKAIPKFENVPILMVTAKDEAQTLEAALAAGAVDYIVKPVERVTLLARIRSALRTKYAFDEIQQLTQKLMDQKRELSNFTHMVSHDLKSPVASAASLFDFFLYRLQDEFPAIWKDESFKDLISRIPGSFKRLLNFVDTMLNYAMSGKTIGTLELVPMGSVVETVLGDFTHLAAEGLVVFEKADHMPNVPCDPVKMGQVWQNLISNAIKYRKDRTPVHIELGCEATETTYRFWVQDNGPGIPLEYHEKVFQPFFRLAEDVGGSGIGLATVQRVLQAHHGKITIDAAVTDGAKFVFELPRFAVHADPSQ